MYVSPVKGQVTPAKLCVRAIRRGYASDADSDIHMLRPTPPWWLCSQGTSVRESVPGIIGSMSVLWDPISGQCVSQSQNSTAKNTDVCTKTMHCAKAYTSRHFRGLMRISTTTPSVHFSLMTSVKN